MEGFIPGEGSSRGLLRDYEHSDGPSFESLLKYLNKLRPGHKVVTYSTVENFEFQTWKDFSDLRLIEPSRDYPVIEVRGVKIDSSNCEALICRISQK